MGRQIENASPKKPASQVALHLLPMRDVAPQSKVPLAGLGGLPLHESASAAGKASRRG